MLGKRGGKCLRLMSAILFSNIFNTTASAAELQQVAIDQVFTVKGGPDAGGSCDREYKKSKANGGETVTYRSTLEKYWNDVGILAHSAHQGFENSGKNDRNAGIFRDHLAGWFGIQFDSSNQPENPENQLKYNTVLSTIGDIIKIVEGKFDFHQRPNLDQRHLFCNGDWYDWTEKVYDINGNVQTKMVDNKPEDKSVHDDNDFKGMDFSGQEIPKGLSQKSGRGYQTYAYWIPDFKRYFYWPKKYRESNGKRNYCTDGNLALTDEGALGDNRLTLMLCQKAFNKDCDPSQRNKCADTIDEEKASKHRMQGNEIVDRQTRSLTLFHELVHVAQSNEYSPDEVDGQIGYGVTSVLTIVAKGGDTTHLPDAYAYFAFAHWLSTSPEDRSSELLNWSSGRATKDSLKRPASGSPSP